jgi:hypothetical protein
MGPEVEGKIRSLLASGQLQILSGRLVEVDPKGDGASAAVGGDLRW